MRVIEIESTTDLPNLILNRNYDSEMTGLDERIARIFKSREQVKRFIKAEPDLWLNEAIGAYCQSRKR